MTYGVKSRSELMGRAAGPVYNFQGAAKGARPPAPARSPATSAPRSRTSRSSSPTRTCRPSSARR
ncbi:MAG: hypothetical protein M0D55_16860 [Elusimicrobiota bacterium]|nr:MAG: hypothetical protein M0D55_16860 [Elusimicrobiota bacterium]